MIRVCVPCAQRLSLSSVLLILGQVASALTEIHACGVVHRDVRAENVLLASHTPFIVKLGDFGISRVLSNPDINGEFCRVITGPVHWVPPEAFESGRMPFVARQLVSKAADIYMFGGLMHEVLTGALLLFRAMFLHALKRRR